MYTKKHYEAGEHNCEICGLPLPAMDCSPSRFRFYHEPECKSEFFRLIHNKIIAINEIRCARPGCTNFVPAGTYGINRTLFFCSDACATRYRRPLGESRECEWCHRQFQPVREDQKYHSTTCANLARGDRALTQRVGPFKPILLEYLDTFAKARYTSGSDARSGLAMLFEFLISIGITDLNMVDPKVISRYVAWLLDKSVVEAHFISFASVFFSWMIAEGRRTKSNPVIPKIHRIRPTPPDPRPYSNDELALIWRILDRRGTTMQRLAVAIGEESGLRISEVCNLRLSDVRPKNQTIYVRTPNKTNRAREVFFHDKTRRYLTEWLQERRPRSDHDFVFCNHYGDPCSDLVLRRHLVLVLCGCADASQEHMEEFSFHRLRHTMASRLVAGGGNISFVMDQGGWATTKAMSCYVKPDMEQARREYQAAMERAQANRQTTTITTRSFESFRQPPSDAA